jgi:ADP-ribose pyrophosphatase
MIETWKPLTKKSYEHSNWRKIVDVDFEMPNGDIKTFSLKEESEVVAVFAMDTEGNVILARQFRPGPMEVLDELPGGAIDEGEDPEYGALRELREETGYEPKEVRSLGLMHECAYSTIKRHVFIALDCEKVCDQNLDEEEYIEVIKKPVDQFIHQLMQGALTDPEVGWAALYHLGLIQQVK